MTHTPTALVTGGTRGLGRALAVVLSDLGWHLVIDGRHREHLNKVVDEIPHAIAIAGDVTDPGHRDTLATAVESLGRLDLLVNNASELGPSPLPTLADLPLEAMRSIFETNVVTPVALLQRLLPLLRESAGAVVNVSSDAAVEPYPRWGGYGASKAALDQLSRVLGAEEERVRVYSVDPGDMRTEMHQRAFPGEDISDRPLPESIVPAVVRLLTVAPASGRYRAADWLPVEVRA